MDMMSKMQTYDCESRKWLPLQLHFATAISPEFVLLFNLAFFVFGQLLLSLLILFYKKMVKLFRLLALIPLI